MTSSIKPFDVTKPVITRDGRKARILCSDFKSDTGDTIVACVVYDAGLESVRTYQPSGQYYKSSQDKSDLVNVPDVTRILVFTSPFAKHPLSQVLNDDEGKEPGEALIARKKAEGTFLKIIEVEL